MGRRRRARTDGRVELFRCGQCAGAGRKSRRGLLHRPGAGHCAPRGRRSRRAAGADGGGVCGVQRPEDGMADHRPDHRLRTAAGMDVLSDGRRMPVHGAVRHRPVPAPAGTRDRGGPRAGAGRGRALLGVGCAVARQRAVVAHADAGRFRADADRRAADRFRAGAGRADLHLGRGYSAWRDLRAADGARHR